VLTLVDVESFARTLRKIDRDLADAPALLEAVAGPAGSGRTARVVYGSGNRHGRLQRLLADADYRLVDVPGQREQLRMRLALDALDAARSPDPPGLLVLAADDLELADLLRRLRGGGPKVIVIGRRHPAIIESSDRLVDAGELETLLPRAPQEAIAESRGAWEAPPYGDDDFEAESEEDTGAFRLVDGDEEDEERDDDLAATEDEFEEAFEDEVADEEDEEQGLEDLEDELDERFELETNGDGAVPSGAPYSGDADFDLDLAIEDEEVAGTLDFDDTDDSAREMAGAQSRAASVAGGELADEGRDGLQRPVGRRRRRSRGGRRRGRGAGGGEPAQRDLPREPDQDEARRAVPAREAERPAPLPPLRGVAAPGDAIGLLREALGRLLQGPPRLVWGTVVLEAMQELDPTFHEGEPAFGSFDQLLEEAQRRGLLRLERSPSTESYLVTAIASA
jgi:hypothetical protein